MPTTFLVLSNIHKKPKQLQKLTTDLSMTKDVSKILHKL